jgi:hypothetical protein
MRISVIPDVAIGNTARGTGAGPCPNSSIRLPEWKDPQAHAPRGSVESQAELFDRHDPAPAQTAWRLGGQATSTLLDRFRR